MSYTSLHEAIADAIAQAETTVERAIDGRSEAVAALLIDPAKRDEEIWRRAMTAAHEAGSVLDADDWDVDLGEMFDIPREDRGFAWDQAFAVALSAAQAQYDAESILPKLWVALQKGGLGVIENSRAVPRPLSAEAKRGPNKATFLAAKERARGGQ